MAIDLSTNDHGVEVRSIADVSWSYMAEAVAAADSYGQAQFFEHLAIAVSGGAYANGKWAMQCRAIAEEPGWIPLNRQRIASALEVLAEHMREDVAV